MKHVINEYEKAPATLVSAFSQFDSATIYEVTGKDSLMSSDIKSVWPGAKMVGTAVTVFTHPADNLMIHKAVCVAGPGDVLVVTVGQCREAGHWGEILTVAAQTRGIVGLVIDGSVRDVEAIQKHNFPVFAAGICMRAATKEQLGMINHPIVCGGVKVNPGDIVVGDSDGVVIIPQQQAEKVLLGAQTRQHREQELMNKLREGCTTLELLGLSDLLIRKGLLE